jgi:ABC-type uncharacterized transport system permease subunit
MSLNDILQGLAGVIAAAGPLVFASVGETIAERAGVINLSVNGTIILTAMVGFAVALATNSIILGCLAGILIGGFVALIVAFSSITLHRNQVAVGFVLAIMCANLAYFLGNPIVSQPGPRIPAAPIVVLSQIPILGHLLFQLDGLTYLSYVVILVAWVWIFKTRAGLILQGIGERPAAAFVRGANVNRLRYIYTFIGGALVGLAGPAYSLNVKAGWNGTISGLDGFGWIALAITIFGGWNPLRAAFGCYLFAFLQWLGLILQPSLPSIPTQVLQVAPFPLMILTLLLVNIGDTEWVKRFLAMMPESSRRIAAGILRSMRVAPPESLGTPFEQD